MLTKEQQSKIGKALTRIRNAEARTAKVREDNERRVQESLAIEDVARREYEEAQKAAGLGGNAAKGGE